VPIVLKYGSLNLLETSGPVQACNGIALPFCGICWYTEVMKIEGMHVVSRLFSERLFASDLLYSKSDNGIVINVGY